MDSRSAEAKTENRSKEKTKKRSEKCKKGHAGNIYMERGSSGKWRKRI